MTLNVRKSDRRWFYLYSIVVLMTACAGTQSIKTGKIFAEPEYELSDVRFVDVDMERLNLEVDLKVTNPNYLSLEFQNVNYQLNIDGTQVLSGALRDKIKVPAKGDFIVTIPLTVDMDNLANGALNLMMNRRIVYELDTKLNSTIPILNKKTFKVRKADSLMF